MFNCRVVAGITCEHSDARIDFVLKFHLKRVIPIEQAKQENYLTTSECMAARTMAANVTNYTLKIQSLHVYGLWRLWISWYGSLY